LEVSSKKERDLKKIEVTKFVIMNPLID